MLAVRGVVGGGVGGVEGLGYIQMTLGKRCVCVRTYSSSDSEWSEVRVEEGGERVERKDLDFCVWSDLARLGGHGHGHVIFRFVSLGGLGRGYDGGERSYVVVVGRGRRRMNTLVVGIRGLVLCKS